MGEHVLHTVYWDEFCVDTYLYGSDIRFYGDKSVYFENLMMPSGMTIKKWMSSTSYQRNRIEPSLPLLAAGRKYALRSYFHEEPSGSVFIRFDFYNQQNRKIGTHIMDEKWGFFTCPLNTYSYTVELVQGGAERVHFYRLDLFPASDKLFYEITNPVEGQAILNFLIPKAQGHSVAVFDEDIPGGLQDYIVLSPFMSKLTAESFDSVMKSISPMDCYDGLCVYLQDEKRYNAVISRGWATENRQFRLWKAAEDE